jgi:hypothetical protein
MYGLCTEYIANNHSKGERESLMLSQGMRKASEIYFNFLKKNKEKKYGKIWLFGRSLCRSY